jgi:broad specificity phosphatase PhoE
MAILYLVRHAQASFMQQDYDRLSPLGEAQARRLGQWWADKGIRIDEVHVGPRVRQRRTAELAGEAYRAAGGTWPESRPLDALDEYQAEQVMKKAALELAQRDDEVRALATAFAGASERRERGKAFERLFQAVTRRWAAGTVSADGVESWSAFCARVHGGLRALTAPREGDRGGGRRVAAFTSAGAIGVALQAVLPGVPAESALEVGWVVRNASLTEILFSGGRMTLSSFNTVPHLEPADWTYR